jgi:succinate dehydrogenase / fumarate reductase, cytochrome b subunit
MRRAPTFFGSTIGKKTVMALSGIVLVGFVVAHMIGNLQVYLGPRVLNGYSEALHHLLHGGGLWIARGVLLLCVGLHIWAATSLTLENRKARAVGYRTQQWRESTLASRSMRWSGTVILVFIVYHLLHLTTGDVHPDFVVGDVYHNFVAGFQVWPVSVFYIAAMLALAPHLYHGVWSMLQTLGLSHPRYNPLRRVLSAFVTVLVAGGNITFPLAVLTGFVR